MALGPGKYDDLCTHVRKAANSDGAIIIIFNGMFGQGFTCQMPREMTKSIPDILRKIASQIEQDAP